MLSEKINVPTLKQNFKMFLCYLRSNDFLVFLNGVELNEKNRITTKPICYIKQSFPMLVRLNET